MKSTNKKSKNIVMLLAVAVAMVLGAGTMFSQNLNQNLVACYPLDCDSGLNMANTGTPYDAISWPAVVCTTGHKNIANTAYYFDGQPTTYIELPGKQAFTTSRLMPSNAVSISGWINIDNVANDQYIVFAWNGCTNYHEGYTLVLNNVGGNCFLTVVKNDQCFPNNQIVLNGGTPLNSGQWYHVGCVVTTTSMELYLDGAPEGSMPHTQSLLYGNANVYLGGTNLASYNRPFAGSMDNFRFYDRQLSALEFKALFMLDPDCRDCGLATYQSNMEACYPLDCNAVNSGPTAGTGPSLNGTVNGATCAVGHTGAANTAYYFGGNASSYISFPNDTRLKPAAVTIALWAKIDNLKADQYIVFTHNGCGSWHEGYAIVAHSIGNNVYYQAVKSSNCIGTGQIAANSSAVPSSTNNWQCVVAYFDANGVKLYVDGLLYSNTGGGALLYNNALVYLGGTNLGFNRPLDGRIDNVKFWSKEITLDEVRFMCEEDIGCDDWCGDDSDREALATMVSKISASDKTSLNVYPNPSAGKFNVSGAYLSNIKVTDITGKQVLHTVNKINANTVEVTLSDESVGIYFVTIFNSRGEAIGTKKVSIQK